MTESKEIVELLQQVGGQGWNIMVRGEIVNAWFNITFSCCVFMICAIILFVICRIEDKDDGHTGIAIVCVGLIFLSIIFILAGIQALIIPEYTAIKTLFGK